MTSSDENGNFEASWKTDSYLPPQPQNDEFSRIAGASAAVGGAMLCLLFFLPSGGLTSTKFAALGSHRRSAPEARMSCY